MKIVYDEIKRKLNLEKHGLDFFGARHGVFPQRSRCRDQVESAEGYRLLQRRKDICRIFQAGQRRHIYHLNAGCKPNGKEAL